MFSNLIFHAMFKDVIKEILTVLLSGGVVVALIQVWKAYLERRWKKDDEKENIGINLMRIADAYDLMNRLIDSSSVKRVLILKAENGGGIPRIGSDLHASVVMEETRPPFKPVKDKYQRIGLDHEYLKMLVNVYSNKCVKIKVDELPNSLLKNIYLSEGVKYAEIHHLFDTKSTFYYCSLATNEDNDLSSSKDNLEIILTIDKIKEIFKQSFK